MEQQCKWILHGTDGLRGTGCTRMRSKLHLPVLGCAFRVTGVMASFVIWKAVLCHIDVFESSSTSTDYYRVQTRRYVGGILSSLVSLTASDFGRIIYLTCQRPGPIGTVPWTFSVLLASAREEEHPDR